MGFRPLKIVLLKNGLLRLEMDGKSKMGAAKIILAMRVRGGSRRSSLGRGHDLEIREFRSPLR
jgi:hypothetical protein